MKYAAEFNAINNYSCSPSAAENAYVKEKKSLNRSKETSMRTQDMTWLGELDTYLDEGALMSETCHL